MKSRFSDLAYIAVAILFISVSSNAQVSINLPATAGWTATGITKTANNTLFVCASGSATVWPAPQPQCPWASPSGRATGSGCATCVCASCPTISLVGRIGNGPAFFIGDQAVLGNGIPNGELQIRVNDNPANYNDNSGSFDVFIGTQCIGCNGSESRVNEEGGKELEEVNFASSRVIVNNPAVDEVFVNVILGEDSRVALKIYSLDGQLINSVQESNYPSGTHEVRQRIEGAAGIYVLQIEINGETQSKKIFVNK